MSIILENDSVFPQHENGSSTLEISENNKPEGGHARRYSTGDIAIPYTRVKILSRYLASSTSSCHDYCKYGIKDDSETKTSNPILKRITEKQCRETRKTVALAERRRTFSVASIPFPGSKRHNSSVPVVIGRKVSSSTKRKIVLSEQLSLPVKIKDAGEKKVLVRPTVSSSVKKVVSVIPKHSVKRDSQPKGQNKVVKEEIDNYQNKARKLSRNGILTAGLSAPPAEKFLGRAKKGIHATQLPQSSEKNLVIHIKDVTTQVIRRAPLSSSALSKSSHSSASCECHESDIMNTVANKLPSKTRPRKGGVICTTEKKSADRRVSFRSGKVFELQPENRTSKGLRFRRRALNDGQMAGEVDTRKNNLKNKEVCGSEANITKMESEKVVLRHKDVQEKKIVQSLLNNLIEETACKLVENRKSKVKALVSAFETVISLQDSTTSSTFCAC
ncbi:muscle M-line assembly protein [Salix suchowensis]|nr:muscle M-line assembly protein [Salix suchowensis]